MVQFLNLDAGIVGMDVGDDFSEVGANTVVEYLATVFGRQDEVVIAGPDAMTVAIVAMLHAPTLAWRSGCW